MRIQIALALLALIAYLLLGLAKAAVMIIDGALAFSRRVRTHLMLRRGSDKPLKPPKTHPFETLNL